MQVLSLFDGISCGQVALSRAGVKYDGYYASEIDKYAITIAKANYPNTEHLGDINGWQDWAIDWGEIGLILAGSPCQGFSFAGKQLAFDDPRSKLFFVFVDILRFVQSINPGVKFLLENVVMKKQSQQVITETMGVEPVLINSALLSAQNRKRLYWCNWPVTQPEDKNILLKDILDNQGDGWIKNLGEYYHRNDKAMCLDANYHKGADNHGQRTLIQVGTINGKSCQSGRIYSTAGKSPTPRSHESGGSDSVKIACASMIGRKINPETGKRDDYNPEVPSEQRLEIREDGKTGTLTTVQKDNLVTNGLEYRKLTPIECGRLQTLNDNYTAHVSNTQRYRAIGNGWTADVIAHILRCLGPIIHE